jgi:para-aminobenzoate synthetase component 1
MFNRKEAIDQMNRWGSQQQPFIFILDFEGKQNYLYPADNLPAHIRFEINPAPVLNKEVFDDFHFEPRPIAFKSYSVAFEKVMAELNYGNTYLVNLTFPTSLETNLNLETIYERSAARYKLLVEDHFVVFSPECFVRIEDQKIYSYPMKGTIDASLPQAAQAIINNPKEAAEHATIVDLIRNDLNRISENVRVERYRYLEKLETLKGSLLQVSSEIVGDLPDDYHGKLGTMLLSLLPAGSISGAPKEKTLAIIKNSETTDRGFFTGVFGVFDGNNLDSAVMIRFIEKQGERLVFKSGGGITSQSEAQLEYEELIQKVYVPFI